MLKQFTKPKQLPITASPRSAHGARRPWHDRSVTDFPDVAWVAIPDIAERFGLKLSQVHRLVEEHSLLAARVDGVLKVPELFLGETEPLRELRGTVMLLLDDGFSADEAMSWLLEPEDSLGTSPVLALRAGRKAEVRRVAQALAF